MASSSPHVATVSAYFESPRPDPTPVADQPWATSIMPSIEQPLAYTFPRSVACQEPAVFSTGAPATMRYSIWNTLQPSTSAGCTASDSTLPMVYSSSASPWPSPGYEGLYAGSLSQQIAGSSSAPSASSWQHQTSEYFPTGIAVDPYGRRYYTYDPS